MKKLIPLVAIAAFLAVSCGSGQTKYLDPNKDKGSKQFGAREIKATVNTMVESMSVFLKTEWKQPAYLQVKRFLNKTSEHIETSMVSNEIQRNLLKRRIKFIDDTLTEDALKEMERGMTGQVDPDFAIPTGKLKSPNLYLTGSIDDLTDETRDRTKQYLVVTLKLVNLKTGEIEWSEQQEFLKVTKK
jgi:uncharacterized protein (TIGR02722 family)